jgi:predicted esterase YcpF (UPF0227 family)
MIAYFHGLNGAASQKPKLLEQAYRNLPPNVFPRTFLNPTYHDKKSYLEAIESVTSWIKMNLKNRESWEPFVIVGSSLGGFAALIAAGRTGALACLINPCLEPVKSLRGKVDDDWLAALGELYTESLSKQNTQDSDAAYKAYINRDDELLYPFAAALEAAGIYSVKEYAHGGHRAENFESEILPDLMKEYADMERVQIVVNERGGDGCIDCFE